MEATAQPSIYQRFDTLASSDLSEFRQFFKRLHKMFPEQAAEACLLYISAHGLDPAAKSMAYWLVCDTTYISVLLAGESLGAHEAGKAIAVLKEVDPQFLLKFSKASSHLTSTASILHTLVLIPALGDYSIQIPWLRSLSQNSDVRVRSRAAKLLCELRPNRGLIEKQLQSNEPRIRAGAVEALWHSTDSHAVPQLRAAALDPHHRVAANALVGLHRHKEPGALDQLTRFCSHQDHLFRMAAAWALGAIGDVAGIPHLQDLSRDKSLAVRKRALKSLLTLESSAPVEPYAAMPPASEPTSEPEPRSQAPAPEPQPVLPQTAEPTSDFKPFLFR